MATKSVEVFEFDETSKKSWWTLVVGGVVSVLFGFVAMIWPGITVGVLALLLAVFLGVVGVLDIVRSENLATALCQALYHYCLAY